MGLALILSACVAAALWSSRSLQRLRVEQTTQGLFGDGARDGLVCRWSDALVEVAEREVRLGYFGDRLRCHAWDGAIAQMAHSEPGRGWTWRFASGETWRVVLKGMARPRGARRVVVRSVDPDGAGLEVLAYVPGRRDLAIHVEDAHLLRR